jgi:hypothetical protein
VNSDADKWTAFVGVIHQQHLNIYLNKKTYEVCLTRITKPHRFNPRTHKPKIREITQSVQSVMQTKMAAVVGVFHHRNKKPLTCW